MRPLRSTMREGVPPLAEERLVIDDIAVAPDPVEEGELHGGEDQPEFDSEYSAFYSVEEKRRPLRRFAGLFAWCASFLIVSSFAAAPIIMFIKRGPPVRSTEEVAAPEMRDVRAAGAPQESQAGGFSPSEGGPRTGGESPDRMSTAAADAELHPTGAASTAWRPGAGGVSPAAQPLGSSHASVIANGLDLFAGSVAQAAVQPPADFVDLLPASTAGPSLIAQGSGGPAAAAVLVIETAVTAVEPAIDAGMPLSMHSAAVLGGAAPASGVASLPALVAEAQGAEPVPATSSAPLGEIPSIFVAALLSVRPEARPIVARVAPGIVDSPPATERTLGETAPLWSNPIPRQRDPVVAAEDSGSPLAQAVDPASLSLVRLTGLSEVQSTAELAGTASPPPMANPRTPETGSAIPVSVPPVALLPVGSAPMPLDESPSRSAPAREAGRSPAATVASPAVAGALASPPAHPAAQPLAIAVGGPPASPIAEAGASQGDFASPVAVELANVEAAALPEASAAAIQATPVIEGGEVIDVRTARLPRPRPTGVAALLPVAEPEMEAAGPPVESEPPPAPAQASIEAPAPAAEDVPAVNSTPATTRDIHPALSLPPALLPTRPPR